MIIGLVTIACEGPMGPQGPQGEQGPPGPVGPAGSDGAIIHAGQGAPGESLGNPGDFYLDLSSGHLYGPKIAEGWGTPINLQGPVGSANVTTYLFTDLEWSGARAINLFYDEDFDISEEVREEGVVLI